MKKPFLAYLALAATLAQALSPSPPPQAGRAGSRG